MKAQTITQRAARRRRNRTSYERLKAEVEATRQARAERAAAPEVVGIVVRPAREEEQFVTVQFCGQTIRAVRVGAGEPQP